MSELDKIFALLLIALIVLLSIIGIASILPKSELESEPEPTPAPMPEPEPEPVPEPEAEPSNGENNYDFVEPQPPQPVFFFSWMTHVNVTGEERTKVLDIAVNDPEVKEWLGKGYEIAWLYDIIDQPDKDMYYIGIKTQEQRLPCVIGISLRVQVNITMEEVTFYTYKLELATLNEKQKDDTMKIAVDYIEEKYGSDYIIDGDVRIRSWETSGSGKMTFYAYTYVEFRVPSDDSQPGLDIGLYVDLMTERVAYTTTSSS